MLCWCGVGGAGSEWCAGVVLVVLEVSGVLVWCWWCWK